MQMTSKEQMVTGGDMSSQYLNGVQYGEASKGDYPHGKANHLSDANQAEIGNQLKIVGDTPQNQSIQSNTQSNYQEKLDPSAQ